MAAVKEAKERTIISLRKGRKSSGDYAVDPSGAPLTRHTNDSSVIDRE